jgi:NAD(P)-dependent dehydrogenase (short-subunit alcohol dehydrogenase family)
MNIIITGASKGIGFETVKAFATDKENKIIAISRNQGLLEKLKIECEALNRGSKVLILPLDLEKPGFTGELSKTLSGHIDSVDILINNAGLLINKPFESLIEQDFDRLFGANVKSVFRLVQFLLPYFKPDSHIVNISSMGGYQGSVKFKGLSLYSSSKGALSVLTECLAEELKERQIKVNCLALGAVHTEMLVAAFPDYTAPVTPESMAGFIKAFALSGHRFFNGKILPVSLTTP